LPSLRFSPSGLGRSIYFESLFQFNEVPAGFPEKQEGHKYPISAGRQTSSQPASGSAAILLRMGLQWQNIHNQIMGKRLWQSVNIFQRPENEARLRPVGRPSYDIDCNNGEIVL
jgi:hypothetical protein